MLFPLVSASFIVPPSTQQDFAAAAGISYTIGNPVLTGPVRIYNIYYGSVSAAQKSIIEDFGKGVGESAWWNIEEKYYYQASSGSPKEYISGNVTLGGTVSLGYTKGKSLSGNALPDLVQESIDSGALPEDPNAVYFIVTAGDVKESIRPDLGTASFCSDYCGYHVSTVLKSGTRVFYSQVGIPTACLSGCGSPSNQRFSPNNDPAVDALISAYAHELAEAVSDPWSDIDASRAWQDSTGYENGDKCAYKYGTTYKTSNGATANMKISGRDYLVQQNWDPVKQACALSA
ncbi:phosphate-induced protein 1 [Gorgonomyces haynaldii]|nr:phosphate-induced protein 1 [Gorgonomyces haynaldii]